MMSRTALKNLALSLAAGVDLARLPVGADEDAIDAAVERYSQDSPRLFRADLTLADGGAVLPVEYEDGFSEVVEAEYPKGQRPPSYLLQEDFYVYDGANGLRLEVLGASAGIVRILFTRRHVCAAVAADASDQDKAAAYTLPANHKEAVACWAAAVLCEMESSRTSNKTEPTIRADVTDQIGPSRNFADRARGFRKRYFDELGIDPKRSAPAGVDVSFRTRDSRGRPSITHPMPVVEPWK